MEKIDSARKSYSYILEEEQKHICDEFYKPINLVKALIGGETRWLGNLSQCQKCGEYSFFGREFKELEQVTSFLKKSLKENCGETNIKINYLELE